MGSIPSLIVGSCGAIYNIHQAVTEYRIKNTPHRYREWELQRPKYQILNCSLWMATAFVAGSFFTTSFMTYCCYCVANAVLFCGVALAVVTISIRHCQDLNPSDQLAPICLYTMRVIIDLALAILSRSYVLFLGNALVEIYLCLKIAQRKWISCHHERAINLYNLAHERVATAISFHYHFLVHTTPSSPTADQQDRCAICLDDAPQNAPTMLACVHHHKLHPECIAPLLHRAVEQMGDEENERYVVIWKRSLRKRRENDIDPIIEYNALISTSNLPTCCLCRQSLFITQLELRVFTPSKGWSRAHIEWISDPSTLEEVKEKRMEEDLVASLHATNPLETIEILY